MYEVKNYFRFNKISNKLRNGLSDQNPELYTQLIHAGIQVHCSVLFKFLQMQIMQETNYLPLIMQNFFATKIF